MDDNQENVDVEKDIVEEYASNSADFERIRDFYYDPNFRDEDVNDHDNPAAAFCLKIITPSIENIPDNALNHCDTLSDMRLLQSRHLRIRLRNIGVAAFYCCVKLRRINEILKEGGVIRLGSAAFAKCGIEGELVIPNNVLFVGGDCFGWCKSITSVIFEPSMTGTVVVLEGSTFYDCTELSSATLPPTLECIPRGCFAHCTALINVPIPPTVVKIERDSFQECTSLPSIDIPELTTVFGDNAFEDCTALTTVTIRTASSDLRFGNDVFHGCTSLSTIRMYPWHWSKLFSAMNQDPTFLFQKFRKYHKTIFDAAKSTRRHRYIRRIINDNQIIKTRLKPVLTTKQTVIDVQQTVINAQQTEIVELKGQLNAQQTVINKQKTEIAMTMVRKKIKTRK